MTEKEQELHKQVYFLKDTLRQAGSFIGKAVSDEVYDETTNHFAKRLLSLIDYLLKQEVKL